MKLKIFVGYILVCNLIYASQPEIYTRIINSQLTGQFKITASAISYVYDENYSYTEIYQFAEEYLSYGDPHRGFDFTWATNFGNWEEIGFGKYLFNIYLPNNYEDPYFTFFIDFKVCISDFYDIEIEIDKNENEEIIIFCRRANLNSGGQVNNNQHLNYWELVNINYNVDCFNASIYSHNYITTSSGFEDYGEIIIDDVPYVSGEDLFLTLKGTTHNFKTYLTPVENENYLFRNWNIGEGENLYINPKDIRIVNDEDIIAYLNPTHPLTVTNNLEGGSSNNNFTLTWQNVPINYSWQFGNSFNAFKYEDNVDIYSLAIPYTFQSLGTTWWFLNWQDGNTNLTRSNIKVPNDIPTGGNFTAYYKGNLRSNTQTAISSNSQKKVAKTSDDVLHMVYESMNQIWYTKSTDNGVNWSQDLMISTMEFANSPDISAYGEKAAIVYQQYNDFDEYYYLIYREIIDDELQEEEWFDYVYFGSNIYDAKPVISINDESSVIAFKRLPTTPIYIVMKYYDSNQDVWFWTDITEVRNTDQNSSNPTICLSTSDMYRILVWQQYEYETQNGSKISIKEWGRINRSLIPPIEINFNNFNGEVSVGSGFVTNINPSVTKAGTLPIVSWTGIHTDVPHKVASKENSYTLRRTVSRAKSSDHAWASGFFIAGNEVSVTSIAGRIDDNPSDAVLVWSENNGQYSRYSKRVNGTFQCTQDLSVQGKFVQINSAPAFSQMRAFVLKGSSAPYSIVSTSNDFSQYTACFEEAEKSTGDNYFVSFGKSGVVTYSTGLSSNSVDFVFNISDIMLNGEILKFVERQDTLPFNTIQELNDALKTVSFNLNNNSELLFSNLYYVVNGESADSLMSENDNINFKVELVKVSNDQPVGDFDNIIYNKNNVSMHSNVNYLINCAGIETGEYYFRLKVEVNGNGKLLSANVQNDGSLIAKKNFTELSFNGENLPETYSLSQNYPNPFNPVTTISYQLPQDGFVTLKIYDILGREVTTLVNEQKSTGRYNIKFSTGSFGDASALSSGVYVYKVDIKGNDGTIFSDIKKMMLLK